MENNSLIIEGINRIIEENKKLKEENFLKEKKIEELNCRIESLKALSNVQEEKIPLSIIDRLLKVEERIKKIEDNSFNNPKYGWNDIIV